jgi:hypothetical protein
MQDYIEIAQKNGIILKNEGKCQFCGADTTGGVHECVEIFSLGFQTIDYSNEENHFYRFLTVDAHTLQHSEIHGRWNNHFHLTRQHLIYTYHLDWNYKLSPKLSDFLNDYKKNREDEYLIPPPLLNRGDITTTDVLRNSTNETECIEMIIKWGENVYMSWKSNHTTVDLIAKGFIDRNKGQLPTRGHKTLRI